MCELTEENIRCAYLMAARLVEAYGEAYLPAFTRLEAEILKIETNKDALARARKLVSDATNAA